MAAIRVNGRTRSGRIWVFVGIVLEYSWLSCSNSGSGRA